MAKKTITATPVEIKKQERELYLARVKNSLRSLDNVATIRQSKKLIAQQKTALTAK